LKGLVYLELERGSVPAIGINLSEQGMAIQSADRVTLRPNVAFRCILPGTKDEPQGHADVIWADAKGGAGIFFSGLTPTARKPLKNWLRKRGRHSTDALRNLLPRRWQRGLRRSARLKN
jgi:hypothetical protein